ncbi:MAG: HDIG domain-containing protein [Spirochaetes bacterium]|nr:MAG: HDIG domain-containing protein [Spirochaetota bacterium]
MEPLREGRVPTIRECDALIARYRMLPNILGHSRQVMRVSLAIADNLKEGIAVDRALVAASALLHDITKTRSIETRERHDETGAALLRELGFPRVAAIVEQHVVFQGFDPGGRVEEREIVYYADKRVMHENIVTIEERVRDLVERYGKTQEIVELITSNREMVLRLEAKLEGAMRVSMDEAIGTAPAVVPGAPDYP